VFRREIIGVFSTGSRARARTLRQGFYISQSGDLDESGGRITHGFYTRVSLWDYNSGEGHLSKVVGLRKTA